jgi:hypothetical protein
MCEKHWAHPGDAICAHLIFTGSCVNRFSDYAGRHCPTQGLKPLPVKGAAAEEMKLEAVKDSSD